jgi:glycosyltransferase involved in cell wall biosynthesis
MPSFNQVAFIEQAIDSVLNQSYQHLELIIADGGSEDGTISLLIKKQQQDSRLKWHSEKDTGPANAINKALRKTRGTVIGWLNSDDKYNDHAILKAVEVFENQPNSLLLYGQGQHIDADNHIINTYPTLPLPVSIQAFKNSCFICQPTVFFQHSVLTLLGLLNENLETAFDFEYWLRAFSAFPERMAFIDRIQAFSRLHDGCITQNRRQTIALESMQILAHQLGKAPSHWVLTYLEEQIKKKSSDNLAKEIEVVLKSAKHYVSKNDYKSLTSTVKKRLKRLTDEGK